MPTRIPQPEDFASLAPAITVGLAYPEVPETTTAILILFHGLGDFEEAYTGLAKTLALPGVMGISVRGVTPLPPALLGLSDDDEMPTRHFHWGDDLTISPTTGELELDPGFTKTTDAVLQKLIRGVLIEKCGWGTRDMLMFGYGQGGSVALGLASRLRDSEQTADATGGDSAARQVFKGIVSVGGPLPASMVPSISSREKARTPALVCHGRSSEAVDEAAMDALKSEFTDVREVKWMKGNDGMPDSREEMLPIMQFFAERLQDVQ
ncbi:uncharacterized protein PG986_001063 [Apiospora aurea]|uniref:Phospholipase/carboxylesterase/thioesterase domain-containing protein n=1 Tax=Apiospora aurea TaxID=335848 RepID=A0ABR1QVS5_9PEZI